MNLGALAAVVYGAAAVGSGIVIWAGGSRSSGILLGVGGILAALGYACGIAYLGAIGAVVITPFAVVTFTRGHRDRISRLLAVSVLVASVAWVVTSSDTVVPVVFSVALFTQQWWVFERSDADGRRALGWSWTGWLLATIIIATTVFTVESVGAGPFGTGETPTMLALLSAALGPAGMAIGSRRHQVVDVRGLVTLIAVNATATTAFVAVAVGVLSIVEERRGPLPLVVVVMVCSVLAFAVNPLRVVLRGAVDRMLFGVRPDAWRAVSGIASRRDIDPAAVVHRIRQDLVLPYVAIESGGRVGISSGVPVTYLRRFPLSGATDQVLVVGLRPGDLTLSSSDVQALTVLAPVLERLLLAQALTEEVGRSRKRLVGAIEVERRRLRRELHDGLGPLLSGVAFTADAVGLRMDADPAGARGLLADMRGDITVAVAEIRRLIEGLRPADLDQLGLEQALRHRFAGTHRSDGTPVTITLHAETSALPAAVEVTVYRIVVESVTNALRHARPTLITVTIARAAESPGAGGLRIIVCDNGDTRTPWAAGVGLTAMAERAELIGGSVMYGPTPDGGRVSVLLP